MLGFNLDIWDFLTFAVILALVGAFLAVAVFVLGLPGRIAIARKHPDADAINTMGWLGFVAVVPWIQAFIWAFKPTNVVRIHAWFNWLFAKRLPHAESAVRDHIEAVRVADLRYKAGTMDILSVLQLQEGQIQSRADLIKLLNAQLANRINLHLALGGSFDNSSAITYPAATVAKQP